MVNNGFRRGRRVLAPKWLPLMLLCVSLGCEADRQSLFDRLSRRILTPQPSQVRRALQPSTKPATGSSVTRRPGASQPVTSRESSPEDRGLEALARETRTASQPVQVLTLAEAIKTAFREQPRLNVYLEILTQAERAKDIAFAPYLPTVAGSYGVGAFHLNSSISDVPLLRTIGIDAGPDFQLAELKLQWLICDFGRRLGENRRAGINAEIAGEQTRRAYQTVANEVTVAYYELLRMRALRKTAIDAVRRAQDDVDVARKLEKGGVVEKEKRLRVEVQLAQNLRMLDETEGAEAIATAALNLAVGLNVNAPTDVQENSDIPPFVRSLAECLTTAVAERREFKVAQQGILLADEGKRIAKADFAPRIVAQGAFLDFQQQEPRGRADFAMGSINLEWTLFEGGARVAQLHISDSRIREAIAQARSIADNIAFQVTSAYQIVITSRSSIEHLRPAVAQAEENHRLVLARSKVGDATSADITDSESTLTRSQEQYLNSIHDYLIALARLEYSMGLTATPDNLRTPGNKDEPGGAAGSSTDEGMQHDRR